MDHITSSDVFFTGQQEDETDNMREASEEDAFLEKEVTSKSINESFSRGTQMLERETLALSFMQGQSNSYMRQQNNDLITALADSLMSLTPKVIHSEKQQTFPEKKSATSLSKEKRSILEKEKRRREREEEERKEVNLPY